MATRPPSEQSIEFQLLDAIQELKKSIEIIGHNPYTININSNAADTIAVKRNDLMQQQVYSQLQGAAYYNGINFKVTVIADRIQIQMINMASNMILWQKDLMFEV